MQTRRALVLTSVLFASKHRACALAGHADLPVKLWAESITKSTQELMIDVAGAVLVGVKVTCTNLAKGVSKVVQTHEKRNHGFQLVPVGLCG
jgi:hypothetical protein